MLKDHDHFALGDFQDGVAKSMNNTGTIYRALGNTESAFLFFDEAIRIYRNLGDSRGMVQALSNKAAVLIDTERYDDASAILGKAEKIAADNQYSYLPLLTNRGIVRTRLKEYDEAEKILMAAKEKAAPEKEFEFSAVYYALGILNYETEKFQQAEENLTRALKSDRDAGYNKGISDDLFALGKLSLKTGKTDSAVDYFLRSLKIDTLLKDTGRTGQTEEILKNIIKENPEKKQEVEINRFFIDLWKNKKRLTDSCE